MADSRPPRRRSSVLPLPDQVALVLQGGGALGSYQAGVYQALDGAGIEVDWIAGISIGAVNAAIIAGNPPERRVERLRSFWHSLTAQLPSFPIWPDDKVREFLHEWSAGFVATFGVPGFFTPRPIPPMLATPGSPEALSFYDSMPLAETLDQLIDWDLLNDGPVRLSVGAVNVETGNFRYFDNRSERLDVRHIMASGALPPELADDRDVRELAQCVETHVVNVVHLIYRANAWEGGSRDYEFSRRTMDEHWATGEAAVAATMRESALIASNILDGRNAAFDLTPKHAGRMPDVSEG